MANHKSTKKSARKTVNRRLRNRYYGKTARNAMRDLLATTDQKEASEKVSDVISKIDKLAKSNIIHKNKANRLKSKIQKQINKLSTEA